MLGSRTLEEWKVATRTTHRSRFARLVDQANSYLEYLPPTEHPRETITYIGMAVANLALAFRLTEYRRYLDRAREWGRIAIQYPHWGKANLPDHDLDAGWLLFGLGLGYDWLREFLPPSERDALCAKLVLQGSRLYDFAVPGEGHWWNAAYWQNHNWICNAGLATAAFALEGDYPQARAWSQHAVANFSNVMRLMPEDGSDYEGVVYWCYGFPWLLIAADLIQQQTGVDLHSSEFLRNTFYYRLYASAPNLVETANFGDCHDRRSAHAAAIYYRLASVYRDGHAQWLAEHFEAIGEWERERRKGLLRPSSASHAFLEFLWYDPTVEPMPIDALPRARAFPDLGLVAARSDWSPRATWFAFKCGKPNGEKAWTLGHALERQRAAKMLKTGHAHPDENSFILMRGNDYLAVDEGYSQKKQSCHHNTVLVDGKGQYREGVYNVADGLGVEWGGALESHFAGEHVVYARGEAANAYEPALTLERFTRQMIFLNGKYLVVCDDLAAREPREFTWLLQTDAPLPAIAPNRFENTVGNSRLRVAALAPTDARSQNIEQEIVAYPSASTPEWVLRHIQHTLMLTSARVTATRFVIALLANDATRAPALVGLLPSRAGSAMAITDGNTRIAVGFASDVQGILVPAVLETDARWVTARWNRDSLAGFAAGDATRVWLDERLCFASTDPAAVETDTHHWRVRAPAPTWVSLWSPLAIETLVVNGVGLPASYDPLVGCVRVHLAAGESEIVVGQLE